MRKMLLSFKADVFERVLTGEKIYEHRKVFPNEPIEAYLYVSAPVKSIVGVMHLNNKVALEDWIEKYSYDSAAVKRIKTYMNDHKFAMEITDFQNTNMISLEKLRNDLPGFVVPQMYYFIDELPLLEYLQSNLHPIGEPIVHQFDNVKSENICIH